MSQLEQQMKFRDAEMVPGLLVKAMFALMIGSVSIVAYAQWTNQPDAGVLIVAPVEQSLAVTLTGNRSGVYEVRDASGTLLASSSDEKAGFIGVIGRAIDRERQLHAVPLDAQIEIVRRDNGNIAILDGSTDMSIELIGYGADNVAAFAQFVN